MYPTAALKRHAFFESLDWAALLALQLEPPIDLSVPYDPPPPTNNNNNNNNNITPSGKNQPSSGGGGSVKSPTLEGGISPAGPGQGPGTPGVGNTVEGREEEEELDMEKLTRHFHEGFTGQHISLSVLEVPRFDLLCCLSLPSLYHYISLCHTTNLFLNFSYTLFLFLSRVPSIKLFYLLSNYPVYPFLHLSHYLSILLSRQDSMSISTAGHRNGSRTSETGTELGLGDR